MNKLLLTPLILLFIHVGMASAQDSTAVSARTVSANDSTLVKKSRPTTTIQVNDSTQITYESPKGYHFITNIPKDWCEFGRRTVQKKGLITVGALAATTAILMTFDRQAMDAVQQFSRWAGVSNERKFANAIKFNVGGTRVNMMDLPQNLNSTLYYIGEGWPTIAFTAGVLTKGLICKDSRAILTASQIAEGYIAMGVTVQLIKRITGRQSPFKTESGTGDWHLFPSTSHYQSDVPNHDAFPSGHLATAMASVTIYAENYPEIRWIRPVGYSVIGLIGLSMMNNGVHWISDYPLALAIGYTYGKIVTSRGKTISFIRKMGKESNKGKLTFGPTLIDRNNVGLALHLSL